MIKIVLMFVLFISGCIGPTPVYMISNSDEFSPIDNRECVEKGIRKTAKIVSRKILNNGEGKEFIYQTKGSRFSKRMAVYEKVGEKTRFFHGANFPLNIGEDGLKEEKKSMSIVSVGVSDECGVSLSKF
ncbi:hypothetical protein [Aurantivibrio plasticivorans]